MLSSVRLRRAAERLVPETETAAPDLARTAETEVTVGSTSPSESLPGQSEEAISASEALRVQAMAMLPAELQARVQAENPARWAIYTTDGKILLQGRIESRAKADGYIANTVAVIYFEERGADTSRLFADPRGESDPIADNESEEGRRLNRRLEIIIEGFVEE